MYIYIYMYIYCIYALNQHKKYKKAGKTTTVKTVHSACARVENHRQNYLWAKRITF